jgi:hypothetical protein
VLAGQITQASLLTATGLGAALSGTGPVAYLVVSIYAVQEAWVTPWLWPARPAGDRGGAICALLVFAARDQAAAVTLRGPRD